MSRHKRIRERSHVARRQLYQLKRARNRRSFDEKRTHSFIEFEREEKALVAPNIFNLRYENCVPVIKYINLIKKTAQERKNIIIDLQNVVDIKEGAVAMLLSVMKEAINNHGVKVKGNLPVNESASKTLEQSGFFKFVSRQDAGSITPLKNIMHSGYRNRGIGFLGEAVREAMATVWGTKGRNPLLRGTIYEMMRNSVDHAFPKAQKIQWHFSISHDDEKQLAKFSFVDNGKGIINSLNKSKLKKWVHRFLDGADVLDTAFHDGMESRTGLTWRGKGLPFIFETYTDNIVKNFLVISNNVFIHYDAGIKELLPVSFEGTYYYWEIDTNCEKACFQ
jgi:hypothetical protein